MKKLSAQQNGCKICRAANDSICNNFCLMTKMQKQAFIKSNAHLFKQARK